MEQELERLAIFRKIREDRRQEYTFNAEGGQQCCVCFNDTLPILQKVTHRLVRDPSPSRPIETPSADAPLDPDDEPGLQKYLDELWNSILESVYVMEPVDASIDDVDRTAFTDNSLPGDVLVRSCCGTHSICVQCLRRFVTDYENHPINENNSHVPCPYPFEPCTTPIGFQNVFTHTCIQKVLDETQWNEYQTHASRFEFPGHTVVTCPMLVFSTTRFAREPCGAVILVPNETIRSQPVGELIIECSQNARCLKRFCYTCKQPVSIISTVCYLCRNTHESENPDMFNYFFNKNANATPDQVDYVHEESFRVFCIDESDYLYRNKELTAELAVEHIQRTIDDVDNYLICSVCKMSMYKTEKCNGLSHHNIERCYACGRIGFKIRGLADHWDTTGVAGCPRFDHDAYLRVHIPEFRCTEQCTNHDMGDCTVEDHQPGIQRLATERKRGYVYHMIKSLLPDIRFTVLDTLLERHHDNPDVYDILPFAQTLSFLQCHKQRARDYSEDVLYMQLHAKHPRDVGLSKKTRVDPQQYLSSHRLPDSERFEAYTSRQRLRIWESISAWRTIETLPLIEQAEQSEPPALTATTPTQTIDTDQEIQFNGYTLLINMQGEQTQTTVIDSGDSGDEADAARMGQVD